MPAVKRPRARRTIAGTLLPRVDGRTLPARRLTKLIVELEGGLEGPITARQRALVGAAASLMLTNENLAADLSTGGKVDPLELSRVADSLERVLAALLKPSMSQRAGA